MPKIIAEICQNHNGDRSVLRDLIWAAKENGADIVKGQIIYSEDLTGRERFNEGMMEENGVRKTIKRPYQAEYDRLKGLDLKEDDYYFFVEEARRAGIVPMMAVFSRNRVSLAASLNWPEERLVKVASYDCASYQMIEELADNFKKLIISTGATFDEEIIEASRILKEKNKPFAFLHCVTSYPNTMAMANLSRMEWLKQFVPEVGWSDHSLVARDGIKIAKTALMLGADYIERHFTILPSDKTKDGPISITPAMLKELSEFAKLPKIEQQDIVEKEVPQWRMTVGYPAREMTHTEMLNRDYYRGRFASRVSNQWVYNWEKKPVFKILNVIGNKYSLKGRPILEELGNVDYLDLDQKGLEEKISDYDILFMQLGGLKANKAVLDNGKKLKIIVAATTGLDHIDIEYAKSKGVEVLSLKGEDKFLSTVTGTAELAFGLIIDLLRLTIPASASVKNYEWDNEKFRGYNLYKKTLGLVGLGRLGKLMAKYGQAFGMKVIACDPYADEKNFSETGSEKAGFEELMKKSDIISIHAHLNSETENLFNKNIFSKMKTTAYLINTSRGKIVNEADLLDALKNKTIAGYATDVLAGELDFEKNFSEHPLVEYSKCNNNLIIVPHIGGTTHESREATDVFMAEKLKKNLRKAL